MKRFYGLSNKSFLKLLLQLGVMIGGGVLLIAATIKVGFTRGGGALIVAGTALLIKAKA